MRFYTNSRELSWMCSSQHVSKVSLVVNKKKKGEYEREV